MDGQEEDGAFTVGECVLLRLLIDYFDSGEERGCEEFFEEIKKCADLDSFTLGLLHGIRVGTTMIQGNLAVACGDASCDLISRGFGFADDTVQQIRDTVKIRINEDGTRSFESKRAQDRRN